MAARSRSNSLQSHMKKPSMRISGIMNYRGAISISCSWTKTFRSKYLLLKSTGEKKKYVQRGPACVCTQSCERLYASACVCLPWRLSMRLRAQASRRHIFALKYFTKFIFYLDSLYLLCLSICHTTQRIVCMHTMKRFLCLYAQLHACYFACCRHGHVHVCAKMCFYILIPLCTCICMHTYI